MFSGIVEDLWRYPVKSMRGERVQALLVDARGAGGDRTHAVWRGAKRLTARESSRLLAWSARYDVPGAELDPAQPPPALVTAPDGEQLVWDDPRLPRLLSDDLGKEVELVRDSRGQQDLADSLLLTTGASLRALAAELPRPLDPRRFRTNLHLELDAPAWAELGWQGGRIEFEGGVELALLHPCERCVIPTRDPETQEKWPQLLKHLHREHDTSFGINARVIRPGRIEAGERTSVFRP